MAKRVPIPKVVKRYDCGSWLDWFKKMYPKLAEHIEKQNRPWSAAQELERNEDPVYMKAKYNMLKKTYG